MKLSRKDKTRTVVWPTKTAKNQTLWHRMSQWIVCHTSHSPNRQI